MSACTALLNVKDRSERLSRFSDWSERIFIDFCRGRRRKRIRPKLPRMSPDCLTASGRAWKWSSALKIVKDIINPALRYLLFVAIGYQRPSVRASRDPNAALPSTNLVFYQIYRRLRAGRHVCMYVGVSGSSPPSLPRSPRSSGS